MKIYLTTREQLVTYTLTDVLKGKHDIIAINKRQTYIAPTVYEHLRNTPLSDNKS